MSTSETTWYRKTNYDYFVEFKVENVQPYYDIYKNGSIILYIETYVDSFWSFLRVKKGIIAVNENDIHIEISEIPERRNCER